MIRKVFIDLFAGLGGASQAFYDDPSWFVIRIDNNEDLLQHTDGLTIANIANVAEVMDKIHAIFRMHNIVPHTLDAFVVWASPPCQEFSNAYNAVAATAARNGEHFEPDMSLVEASSEIISLLDPPFWYIENVRGAITPFKPLLGKWRQQIGSFFVWGAFPLVAFEDGDDRSIRKLDERHSEMRAQIRAKVPLVISQAIKDSIDNQKSLTYWFD